jgi:hypothetical protein
MVKVGSLHTAWRAVLVCIRHYLAFLHLGLGWVTLLAGLVFARMVPWPDAIAWLLLVTTLAAVPMAAAAFLVACSRVVLLDEEPPLLIKLGFGAREGRCALHLLAVAALPAGPLLLLLWLRDAASWWAPLAALGTGPVDLLACAQPVLALALLVLLLRAALGASCRLAIAIPAIALDEPGPLLATVWRHSRDNTVPLLYGWLLAVLPAVIPWIGLYLLLDRGITASIAAPVAALAGCPLGFVALAVSAAYFAYVFAQLAEGAAPADAPAAGALAR